MTETQYKISALYKEVTSVDPETFKKRKPEYAIESLILKIQYAGIFDEYEVMLNKISYYLAFGFPG